MPHPFAYHGYPWRIHRLTCRRTNDRNLHLRGYKEGCTTTSLGVVERNDLDRFRAVMDVIDRVPRLRRRAAPLDQGMRDKLVGHGQYINAFGEDMPEIRDRRWPHQTKRIGNRWSRPNGPTTTPGRAGTRPSPSCKAMLPAA